MVLPVVKHSYEHFLILSVLVFFEKLDVFHVLQAVDLIESFLMGMVDDFVELRFVGPVMEAHTEERMGHTLKKTRRHTMLRLTDVGVVTGGTGEEKCESCSGWHWGI